MDINYKKENWKEILNCLTEASNRYLYINYYNEETCKIFLSEMEELLVLNIEKRKVYKEIYKKYKNFLKEKNLYGMYLLNKNKNFCTFGNIYDIYNSLIVIKKYINNDNIDEFNKLLLFFKKCFEENLMVYIY